MGYLRCLPPAAVLASLLGGPLARAEAPQLLPTRDVDVTYDVALRSQPRVRERVRWLAAEQLERVDGPHKSTTIFNRRTHQMILLTSETHTFLQLDMPARQPEEPAPEAKLKRGNESVVAGLHCVDWSWTEEVETRTVCITADGVLLRFIIDSKTVTEARSVSYRSQPAELFQVPRDWPPALRPSEQICSDPLMADLWRTERSDRRRLSHVAAKSPRA